jgi:hypothetical protein
VLLGGLSAALPLAVLFFLERHDNRLAE